MRIAPQRRKERREKLKNKEVSTQNKKLNKGLSIDNYEVEG